MAKNSITDYDNIANNNTDIQSVDIAENCAPSGINNAIREMMADLADVNDGTVALTSPKVGSLTTDTISESTSGNGVAVDGMTIKDGAVGTTASPATANLTAINGGQIGGRRNMIINGDMRIDQRNSGGLVTGSAAVAKYAADRFYLYANTTATITMQQVSDAPSGFFNSNKITCTVAATGDGTGSRVQFGQVLEGYDTAHLNFGTGNAKTITLSFWVKASNTGNYGGSFTNGSGAARCYPFSYTVNSANTWERKTITISGDTAGTWTASNTANLIVLWGLGVGSNYEGPAGQWNDEFDIAPASSFSLKDNLNATWQITGVQLEVGSVATEFEHRSYGEELALCQRYYEFFASGTYPGAFQGKCSAAGGGGGSIYVPYKVTKRANGTVSSVTMRNANTGATASASAAFISTHGHAYGTGGVAGSIGDAMHINSIVTVDSEL